MFKKTGYFLLVIAAVLTMYSCGKFSKILKSTNLNDKYQAAQTYYQKGDYFHALQLFEELMTYYRGTTNAEKIAYYYAYCHYAQGDYLSASYYFNNFSVTYPDSKYSRECQYMAAYCSYMDSPEYSLDQTNTTTAVKELQLFVDMYPKSDSVALCNNLIDDLRGKMELKEYEIAKLYFKIEEYKAAITAFKNTLKDYPDTKFKENILFSILKANYLYAANSIDSKKQERFTSTIDAYNTLISAFPQTKNLKDAENYKKNAQKELTKLSSITTK
jgi:outer membrane protein assembly factor BamD